MIVHGDLFLFFGKCQSVATLMPDEQRLTDAGGSADQRRSGAWCQVNLVELFRS